MTTQEQEPINNQETRVWDLRDEIIAKVNAKSFDPTTRPLHIITITSDGDKEGWSRLHLHVTGEWSVSNGQFNYPLNNPKIPELLAEYASIRDDEFRALKLRQHRESQQHPTSKNRNPEELAKHFGGLRRYIEENKAQLLQGFISSLETTLQNL